MGRCPGCPSPTLKYKTLLLRESHLTFRTQGWKTLFLAVLGEKLLSVSSVTNGGRMCVLLLTEGLDPLSGFYFLAFASLICGQSEVQKAAKWSVWSPEGLYPGFIFPNLRIVGPLATQSLSLFALLDRAV